MQLHGHTLFFQIGQRLLTYTYAMANNPPTMKLHHWVNQKRGRSLAMSQALGVSAPVVSDWVTGKKAVPVERCVFIERATDGAVTRQDLRPDDWQDIWPELAASPANRAQAATQSVAVGAV